MSHRFRLGIDVGGTFTDFAVMDETTGRLVPFKQATTPAQPAEAVVAGLRRLAERGDLDPAGVHFFVHGTTLATNTVIERRGARTGLLVTEGFRDLLTIARLRLANPFDFTAERPVPLVPRRLTREVVERIMAEGSIIVPLDEESVRRELARLRAEGIEALAISFMNAYRNPVHEQRARAIAAAECPGVYISTSSEVWPQIREYERTLVTVMNAYVGKRLDTYFSALETDVRAAGVSARIFVTKSNGGIMSAHGARQTPVELLLSGPAAGVVGATYVATLAGHPRIVTLDIGGTSADLSVADGQPLYSTDGHVGEFPVTLPAVDVVSIGAGGGSIAWTDAAGVLKVGPESAGATPGPACYGLGGSRPTLTDAYVALGYIDPDRFLGGTMPLRPDLATKALATVATTLRRGVPEAAEAVVQVATSTMHRELVSVLARRGIDPGDYALFVFGGAGATHGFLLAQETGIRRVVVPLTPGILCALGALIADVKRDFIKTTYLTLGPGHEPETAAALAGGLAELGRRALGWLQAEGLGGLPRELRHTVDMRYVGQSFELEVPVTETDLETRPLDGLIGRFHDAHLQIYGYAEKSSPAEIINLRTTVVGCTTKPALPELPQGGAAPAVRRRRVFYAGEPLEAVVVERSALPRGFSVEGPAVVEQYDTTTFVPPGWRVTVDRFGNLIGEHTA